MTQEQINQIKEYGWHLTWQDATWCYPKCKYYSLIPKDDADMVRDKLAAMFTTTNFYVGQTIINNTIYQSVNFYCDYENI